MLDQLLWLETLLAAFLFAAMILRNGAKRGHKKWRIFACFVALGIPLLIIAVPAFIAWGLYVFTNLGHSLRWWLALQAAAFVAGTVAIIVLAYGTNNAGNPRAARWNIPRLAILFSVTLLAAIITEALSLNASLADIQNVQHEAATIGESLAPPPIPRDEDAWTFYKQAEPLYTAAALLTDKDADYLSLDPASKEVRDYLNRQKTTIAVLRAAADRRACGSPRNFSALTFDELSTPLLPMRGYANLLICAARAEALNGQITDAMLDLSRANRIGQHTLASPSIVSSLIDAGINHSAAKALAVILPAVTDATQLAGWQSTPAAEITKNYQRALTTERVAGLWAFTNFSQGKTTIPYTAPTLSPFAGAFAWQLFLKEDLEVDGTALDLVKSIAAGPYSQTATQRQTYRSLFDGPTRRGFLSAILLPSLGKANTLITRAQVISIAADVIVAATRYRLDQGHLPATLNALVPTYCPLPVDPFTGAPMLAKYIPNDRFTIYSLGEDLTDDGGQIERIGNKTSPDVGLTLPIAPNLHGGKVTTHPASAPAAP